MHLRVNQVLSRNLKKARRAKRNLGPDNSDSKSGSGSDTAETSNSDEEEATGVRCHSHSFPGKIKEAIPYAGEFL